MINDCNDRLKDINKNLSGEIDMIRNEVSDHT
jgi:hypothetical protein